MNKKRIVVICPGRGSYTRDTNNYLNRYGVKALKYIRWMDDQRKRKGFNLLTELDSQPFQSKIHMVGENASSLIYACSIADFFSIDQNEYKVVAITGNSMGWYTSLALSGSISIQNGFNLVDAMGSMMKDNLIGGQLIYPITYDNWKINRKTNEKVLSIISDLGLYVSIRLGGYLVIGGEKKILKTLLKELPKKDHYPLIIPYHAAFHTPLLDTITTLARKTIDLSWFNKPSIPIIDGRGKIWSPYATNPSDLWDYTVGHQVLNTYDFTSSINVGLKEFCPDMIILLGPGNSLGGPVGQIIIDNTWLGLQSKKDFIDLQANNPFILSLGIPEQRNVL